MISTSLALVGATWLDRYTKGDFQIFGFYAYGIFPVGALVIGLVAASGYAAAAWFVGIRVSGRLLFGVAILTFVAYLLMHWLEFEAMGPLINRSTNARVGFLEYFDLATRSMRLVSTMSPPRTYNPFQPPEPEATLGVLGYGLRLLEVGGFMLGTLCLPLMLRNRRYCDLCEMYYQKTVLAIVPASVALKKTLGIFTPGKVALDGEHALAGERASVIVEELSQLIVAGDSASFRSALSELERGSNAAKKLPRRINVLLSRCPRCGQAVFHPTLLVGIDPRKTRKHVLCENDVSPAVADAIRPRQVGGE